MSSPYSTGNPNLGFGQQLPAARPSVTSSSSVPQCFNSYDTWRQRGFRLAAGRRWLLGLLRGVDRPGLRWYTVSTLS
ncbi:MAG: hypothetical protein KDJ65_29710 [Anaerolineae bacterium]|nr:hypothetical protein [Anaerolineae bacterium]